MRQRLRAVGLVALAIVAITCTDAPTSPTKIKPVPSGVANVRMSPSFSAEAARIYSGLAAFGLEVTEVHVLLTGPDGSKKDTVIAFPVNQGQITIEIPVPASGTDQSFDALVELRNDQHVVLFSGHQTVIARAANLPAQTPPLVVISYTGPGKGTKTVSLSPPDTTIAGAATVAMKATAVDSAGLPVTNLLVRFAVSDATLAVATSTGDATGTLSGLGKRGAAIVSAITPLGVTGSSRITFVPPAARIVVISGSGQTGIAGRTLTQPLVVEVQATDNLPVPNAVVTFRAVTAGGSVQQATVFADASGRASTTLTLGPIPGAYVFEAGSGALTPVSVSATATPAPAAAIAIVSGDAQVDTVGKTLPLPFVVKVTDQFGGAVGGATVTWTTVAGNGLLGATSTSTGANGTTSITYSLGTTASNDTIRASVAGVPNSVLFSTKSVSRGPATIAIVSGGNQTGLPNTTLPTPLVARVSDAQNNPIAGATVTWSATGAGASFNPVSSLTDPTGQASTVAALGANAGTTTVTATVGTVTATTTLTTVGGNTFSILAGDQQSALAGTAVALAPGVVLKDGLGNPIANAPVIFAVASGGGSITGGTTTTNSFGVATVGSWTLGATPGANRLTATSGTLSVTFTATGTAPAGPNHLVMAQGPPSPFVIGAPPVTVSVQLFDGQNNPVRQSGLVVTLAGNASPGPNFPTLTASTDNTGTATFSVPTYNGPPGTVSFDISAPGVTGLQTQAIPIVAGAASMFVITTQPSATVVNQAPFPQQPVVQLADANGNPVNTAGVVVTATFASGPTTPTPVLSNATATTNASGQATFAGMSINGPFGVYRLSFSSNLGATAAVSNTITNGAGPANTLLLFGGNGQNAPISTPVGVPPIAKVIDAQGNGVPGVVVTFTAVNSGSTVSDGTTTGTTVTVTTNSFGNAQLTAWTMSPTAGPHTVTASATVPNGSPVTFTANATAAGASKFILLSPFPTQIVVGAPHPPINIQIADANNNPVQQGNVSVNFNGNVQPGGFNFNFTLQTNAQGIINLTLSPYVGQIGNEIITIAATGFTTVTSPAIPVVAGAASTIRVTTQPPATARSGVLLSPQPVVRVVDDGNNPVSTAGIPINVNATGATVGGTTTINTNASGQAVFTDLFVAGPVGATSLQFYNPSLSPAVSTVINLTAGPAASMTIDAGNNQTVPAGSSVPILPAVLVKDAGGNPVAGVNVLFTAVTPNSYIDDVTSKTIQTNAQGIAAAQFFWQVSTTAGTNTLTASATGLANSPLTFTATGTPGPAADMKLLQAMPASITVGLPFPAVQVQLVDGNGNNVAQSNTVITATVNVQPSNTSFGLNATTASNGVATFNVQPYIGKIGTMTFILSAPSINTLVTSGITVLAGAPNKLLVTTQPPASAANGVAFTPQPAVQVNDVGSNPVNATTNVLATIASGAGTLGGTTTIATNASGLATYSNLALSGAPGSFTLRFAASGLTAVVSNNITLGTGGPSAITIVAGDQQVAAAGTSVAVAPSVRVTDGSGTPLAGVAVTFAPTLGGGSTPPGSVLTNSSGVATSGGWQLGTSVGTNNLSASVGALSATFTATAVAGPAARLAFITPPPPTAASGIALNPQPSVQLQDNFGNPVSSGGVQVTASVLSGSGALTNTTATTTTGGLATFSGLTITGPAGGVTLDFTAPNVTHIASSAITVSAGGPSAIAISAGNNQTATVGTNVATAPSVRVTDGSGNPVQSVQVTFTVTSGSGLVTGTPATTNASGVATVGSWQLGNIAGANSLSATIGALSTTFNATGVAAPPAALSFTTQPPANSASGAPLSPQPVIQVRDAFGNATAATGTVTAVITSGTGTLNNATATIGAGGVATFSALTINGSGTFTLQFQSGSLTPVSSSPITQAAGPAVGIAFSASPAGGTGGVAFSPAVTVRLVDAQSNTVTSNNTNTVTLSIAPGTGTTGATLAGPGPITFVNGVATFPSAAIDFGGTGYVLRATTNALNVAGAQIPSTNSSSFNVQPGPSQLLSTKSGTRVSVAAVGASNPPGPTSPVFVARNASGNPATGLTVDVAAFGRCRLMNAQGQPFTNLSYVSDVNGEVKPTVSLPTGAGGAGCTIKATGATFTTSTDSAQIAVFPLQTSHVWTGGASNVWTNAANWIPVISTTPVPSSTSDNVFIPNYNPQGIPVVPVVSGPKPAMNRLQMDTAAIVSLNNIGIDIGGGGVLGFGFTNSGSIHMTSTAPVEGIFDVLDIGQTGCGQFAPFTVSLRTVSANVMNVRCHARIDTTGVSVNTLNVIPNSGQGWLQLSQARAGLAVSGNANFTGDSLVVTGGVITVSGTSTFGGRVTWLGGTLSTVGPAVFASTSALYQTMQMFVQGDATFGGASAGQQNFAGGQLTLLGNFSQVTGIVGGPGGLTFSTSVDHVTVFAGTSPQTVAFANPTTSKFSVLQLQNQSAGGVQLTTDAQIINGTAQPRVEIASGRLQVNSGKTLTLNNGDLHFGFQSNLNLLGDIALVRIRGGCTGRSTNSATITGPGLFNGSPYDPTTCTP